MHFRQSFAGDPDSWIKVITPDSFSRIKDKDKDRDKVDTIDNDNNREVEYKEVGDKKVEHKKVKYKKVTGEVKEGGGWVWISLRSQGLELMVRPSGPRRLVIIPHMILCHASRPWQGPLMPW